MLDARAIAFLQNRLGLPPSGLWNNATLTALKVWQTAKGLKADGVYGPITNKAMTARTPGTLKTIAKDFALDAKAFAAIVAVETSGAGFLDDGRPKILLERHYVYRLATGPQRDALTSDVCYPTAGGYGAAGSNQWDRFEKVAAIDLDLAVQSVSWGLGQVMGANWKDIGETTPQSMMWRAGIDEYKQLCQMAAFILTKTGLKSAINAHDWPTVARLYNGPNFAENDYQGKLLRAFESVRRS